MTPTPTLYRKNKLPKKAFNQLFFLKSKYFTLFYGLFYTLHALFAMFVARKL